MAGNAAARYSALESGRSPYLDRARECAKLTIPMLLPENGANGSTQFTTPEQSLGARGLNNVSAKLLMALFPPNAPFMKMEVDDMTAGEMTGQKGLKDEVDKAFSQFVRRIMTDFEARALRSDLYECFRLLTMSGNVTLYVPEDGRGRVYRLDRYVCRRDASGNLIEWVSKEPIARAALPEDIRGSVPSDSPTGSTPSGTIGEAADEILDLFTHITLSPDGTYAIYQEVGGMVVPGSEGSYVKDELPFLVLRYNKVDGEDYGRGLIEEYLGDLTHMESLSKSIREFVAISARVIPILNPNGTITARDLVTAKNGEPILGDDGDVKFLQIERYNDFRVAKEMIGELTQRLSYAWLMNTAIQRPGERVTAEEIRFMARELEDTLGGTYSVQSVDLQLPLAKILIKHLERRKSLPELPPNVATPKVVTGMDALGRGSDLSNLMQWKAVIAGTPAEADVKWDMFALRTANSLNVSTEGLVKTPEEKQAEQQQMQMMQLAQQLGPNAINQMGGIAQKQMEAPNGGE